MENKKSKKNSIGICTLFYNNSNYGANLQAYALSKVVKSFGYNTEQIQYVNTLKYKAIISKIKNKIKWLIKKRKCLNKQIHIRNKAIAKFRNSISHSKLYYYNTIDKANKHYNCFITGSDQVWNPSWINRFMSLEFVRSGKKTVAYGASVGKIFLDAKQKNKVKIALEHTDNISLREKESIPALKELTNKQIDYVLDPTLLFSKNEWDKVCSKRVIDEEYMFCYFLKGKGKLRDIANQYAKKNNIKIVTLPYLNGEYRNVDDGFGDCQLYNISPCEFISLIKYSSFVLTDSFHGTVFSHIYQRKFLVVGDGEKIGMGCRMQSLTELFGTENRYIESLDLLTVEILEELAHAPLNMKFEEYNVMREHSLDFLKKALKDDRKNM